MLKLHNRVSLVRPKKRVGRGGARGGTSCRGHKGQNARSGGGVSPQFEGGQLPLVQRLPKRGFNNARFRTPVTEIDLRTLSQFEEGTEVTKELLCQAGLLRRVSDRVKVLANGDINTNVTVYTNAISASARQAIEHQGGQVHIIKE